MYKFFLSIGLLLLVSGCVGDSTTPQSVQEAEGDVVYNRAAKHDIGYLTHAKVEIFELNDDNRKLLFTEYTTDGDSLDAIGNFDPHMRHMDREKRYMYQVSGGLNWDMDKDGHKDTHATPNGRIYRAIYQAYKPKVAWWSIKTGGNDMAPSER